MNYISQQEPNQMWIKKVLMLVLADILIVLISYFMALLLRFDFVFSSIPEEYLMGYLWSMPFWIISTIVIFYICRLYHSIWRLASVAELQMILIAYSILAVVYSLGMLFMQMHMPRSYYFIGFLLNFLMTTGLRFSYRLMRFWVNSRNTNADTGGEMHAKDHVMVIGAGAAGQALIKEIINSKKLNTQVVCIIDDNPTKHGRVLEGITIVGDRYSIPEMAKKYKVDRIIYAIPEAAADDRKAILNICKDTGCRLQTVPGVYQLVNGEVSVSRLRNVEITDLLGRAQVQVNMDEIYSSIQGKTLLVTGGGGSIGSELCRQIAASHPKKLIIFDMYENNAYEIQQELRRKYGDSLDLEVLIGSVRNTNRIRSIMQKYKPDVVFHAAAHKHVPLMEDSPNEAIKNNVMGTYKTAVAASRAGVKKFVLISTDKAVNPTNIMGASKRLCEMVVQMMNRQCKDTDFVAVRFGNVLGSNGSVIPLFKKQIAEGGPVTVTDKNIIRYFMTIPEAVSLVLQAAHYAKGGDIFILDMDRAILSEMLKKDFDILEAENGKECLDILQQYGMGISLVLLDIVMPVVDGFEVLDVMVHNHWIEDIPVIMISSEDSEPYIRRAYELGVSDYINRPFDAKIVCQRVYNTIKLYAKQRKLVTLVTDQIYEKEKNNQMMISILSQIVEFRNGESGLHVLHINILSELLLERLVQKTDKYQISAQRRSLITTASALHDIGKIGIDDKILNKPGRLTPEEFDEMKKHTIIGESILKNVGIYQNEELVQLAMHICRWHHERYDGRGYPDGLKGEEIPIEVQVVSIADVYDALVSERVYKKAYSHKKAVEMILNGECGQFNPLLLECLQDIQDRIDEEFQNVENQSEEENQERKVHDQIMETTVLG